MIPWPNKPQSNDELQIEVANLRQQLADKNKEYEQLDDGYAAEIERHNATIDQRDALQTQLDEAQKDAGRYQWLRGDNNFCVTQNIGIDWIEINYKALDAALDAAMKENKE